MLEYLVLGEFVVSLLMAFAAVCALFWAELSGTLRNIEGVKQRVLEVEDDDGRRAG